MLMTGAAFVIVTGMGITAVAAGPNLFAAGTVKPGNVWHDYMSRLQWYVGRRNCVTADAGRFDCQPVTYGVHHVETEGCEWTTDIQDSAAVYTDVTVSCHISDGYCMNWSDADGDGVCDMCRNPAYCGNIGASGVGGNCHISDGYCMNWSDVDGDGVCDMCRNPVYFENSGASGAGGNCRISDGYCMNWSDADGDGVCDMCRNPAYCENSAGNGEQSSGNAASQDSGSAVGSQGQNYGGYGSGYNGCGNSHQGHHGSGHHGSGHHR